MDENERAMAKEWERCGNENLFAGQYCRLEKGHKGKHRAVISWQ